MDQNIRPLDLVQKRKQKGWTQQALANKLHISRVHLARIESGMRDVSFPIALDCVKIFGSLAVEYQGAQYLITSGNSTGNHPQGHSDDIAVPSVDLDLPDEISRLGKEARELLMQAKDIGNYVLAIKCNPKVARPYLLRTAKEAIDLAAWLEEFKESLRAVMPEVYEEAEKIVREEFAAELDMPALEVASA